MSTPGLWLKSSYWFIGLAFGHVRGCRAVPPTETLELEKTNLGLLHHQHGSPLSYHVLNPKRLYLNAYTFDHNAYVLTTHWSSR